MKPLQRRHAAAIRKPGVTGRYGMKLPGLLQQIAEITDLETALAVARVKGGEFASFTPNPRSERSSWLTRAVGLEKARLIGRSFCARSGVLLLVPRGPEVYLARKALIEEMTMAGHSVADIARKVGLHTRTITHHRARMRAEGKTFGHAAEAKHHG